MARERRNTARAEARRAERLHGWGPDGQQRTSLAQATARLIATQGLTDGSQAKRKAARELGVPERAALPGDDEVEDALVLHHAIYGGERHRRMLAERRTEALIWMRALAAFDPRLVGGVAAGWATEHSDIRIELAADDDKAVELALLNARVAFRALPGGADESPQYYIETPRGGVRLAVRSVRDLRARPKRDRHGRDELRLDRAAVETLIGN